MKALLAPILFSLAAAGPLCLAAESPTADNSAERGELRFRRVYFPEGMKDWPKGDVKYLPMDAEEFDRLIEAIQKTAPGGPAQSSVGLVEARYEARLKGPALLQGSATLNVSQSIASAMLMTLDPCNLAISRAQWVTSDGDPAVMGLTDNGKLQVLAERSGQMKFDWSLNGRQDSTGGVSFAIALPPSPANRLRVEMPAGLAPTVDHGIVTDEGPVDLGFHRWRLDLGGRSECRLRLVKAGSEEARRQTVLASRSSTYDFSLLGVNLSVTLNIEAHREPLPKVVLGLDPSLELVSVSTGDGPLSWNVAGNRGDKARQMTIELPPSLQEGATSLTLRAFAPLSTAGPWKLPRMIFHGIDSRTSTIHLSVQSPLHIDRLDTHGCRQTGVAAWKTSVGEQMDFESFDADAAIDVSMSQRSPDVQAVSATATRLGQGKMNSRVTTDFRTRDGPVFSLAAEVLPNWTIDSIESQPTDGLDDWSLSRGDARRVSIRLSRPLSSAPPLRLIVSARRLYASPGQNLGIDDLVPLRFAGLSESKRWIDLSASGGNELRFASGDHSQRVDAKDLTAAELDLFAEPPGDLLFREDTGTSELRFSLENRRPTYSATIHVEAIAGNAVLTENYTFACTPSKAAPIDRVVVHFTGRRDGPLNWSVVGMDESRFSARRSTVQQQSSAGLMADEEVWEVAFRSPRSVPVEIRASRKTGLAGATSVCLASLPDAARQEATLTFRNLGAQIVQFKTRRLQLLPVEAPPPGQVQTVRASYQFDPQAEVMRQSEPALVLMPAGNRSAAAWVWNCEMVSRLYASGGGDHTVSYTIQNAGSHQIDLKLPAGLLHRDVHGIWVNDKPAAAPGGSDSAARDLSIDLPGDLKIAQLEVRFSTHGEPMGTFSRLRPPLPEIGLPVFSQRWRMELPPGYTTLSLGQDPQATPDASFSLRRCLFGGLVRGGDQSVFNPLQTGDWQSLLRWRKMDALPAKPAAAVETVGWRQFPIEMVDGTSTVLVARSALIETLGWTFFLGVIGIGAWGLSARPFTLLLLAVVLGLPALLLPPAISTVLSRGLLGVIFCLLLGLVRRRMAADNPAASGGNKDVPSTLTNVVPFGAPLLAFVMLCGSTSANAAEPAKSPPVTHSVFIPVDEKQQPTQGKYFLPEPFFAELYHREGRQVEKPQGWMIASAVYRAALVDDAAHASYLVDRLATEFDVRIFNASARVRIPLRRGEVSLEPGQAKLDDRSIQPDWEPDGSALFLENTEPGEHRLDLTLRPTVRQDSHPSAFDLAIPRVPTARLEFTVPAGGPRVEFPSALGAVRWEEVQSRWSIELGPCNRLAANWQDSTLARSTAGVDVEQLLWLKIEQGCVLLDVRMKAKAAAGQQLRRLLVQADSALELLPSTDPAAPTVQTRGRGDTSQTYEIQWPETIGSTSTFDMHFLWNGAASLGTFRVPNIDVGDAKPARRWLAVSLDPALAYQMPGTRLQETGAIREFIDNWGASNSSPDLAFRLNGNAAEWSLTTRARRIETSGDQNTTWSFNAQSAAVQLDAQLNATGGNLFQYRLESPPALMVDSIAVQVDGANRVARWSQDKDGHISVFLAGPVSGRHELLLHGQMPLPSDRKLTLPQIRLDEVRIQNSLVSLYRQPDILVEVSGVPKLADVRTIVDDAGPGYLGRPVRSFYADLAAISPVLVTIKPNRPSLRAEQVTRVVCKDNLWLTTCEYNLQVSGGLLDTLELDIPASWHEHVKISPTMADTFSARSEQCATVVLSPSAAISGSAKFTLTGPPVAASRFAVPNIALKHVESMKRYVVLPNSTDRRSVDWDRRYLRRCNATEGDPDDSVKYEVVGDSWQAVLSPLHKGTAATRVVQADVRFSWQADGRCLGAAFFDVETAGAIDCPLQLPEGYNLLQLTVDGLPVDAVRGAGPTWIVPLASQSSPSRVELLYFTESALRGTMSGWTRRCSFRAPKLGDLPVERILWTVASPGALQPSIAGGGSFEAPPSSSGDAKVGAIAAQWRQFVEDGQAAVSYATNGATDSITLDYRPSQGRSWLPRLAAIAGFLAIVGLVALLFRRGRLWKWFARWPYLFGVGVGLVWWLWLSPSALGLLIVLVVLLRQFLPWRWFPRSTAARSHHAPS